MRLLITGLPGSGKTTLADAILNGIASSDVIWLDGDMMRKCWPFVGYSPEGRDTNQRRLCTIAGAFDRSQSIIVSSIMPTVAYRDHLRQIGFTEVLLNTAFVERPANYTTPLYQPTSVFAPNFITLNTSAEICAFADDMVRTYIEYHRPEYNI